MSFIFNLFVVAFYLILESYIYFLIKHYLDNSISIILAIQAICKILGLTIATRLW